MKLVDNHSQYDVNFRGERWYLDRVGLAATIR